MVGVGGPTNAPARPLLSIASHGPLAQVVPGAANSCQLAGGSENKGLALLDVGVNLLQGGNRECSGLASTGLGLGNDIVTWWERRQHADKVAGETRNAALPLMTGMMARCWIAEGRSKP